MLELLLGLDPTVQVALLGVVGTVAAGVWAIVRVWLSPEDEKKEVAYGPRPVTIVLSEGDQLRIDRAIFVVESFTDTLERLRVQLAMTKFN